MPEGFDIDKSVPANDNSSPAQEAQTEAFLADLTQRLEAQGQILSLGAVFDEALRKLEVYVYSPGAKHEVAASLFNRTLAVWDALSAEKAAASDSFAYDQAAEEKQKQIVALREKIAAL